MSEYTLALLRHGESLWNRENRFTGWTDVALTERGRGEARAAARRMAEAGLRFDLAFTSMLCRAWESLEIVRSEMPLPDLTIRRAWQLNERHYGCLQGLNKAETAVRLGEDRVTGWRRSLYGLPPALELDDHRHPRFDRRYAGLPPEVLPRRESLADTIARILPYWQSAVAPEIRSGKRVLIVAHGNSLRAMVRFLEAVPESAVPGIQVPTGVPLIYKLDIDLRPVRRYDLIHPRTPNSESG